MSCWQVLELAPQSDAKAIKRRYAELLKVFRPDQDPVAFQRLREAYEQALAFARHGASVALVSVEASEVLSPAAAEPVHEYALPELTLDHLDEALASSRQQQCQPLFEQRLLSQCLGDADNALPLADWALKQLQWLTPWQNPGLPAAQLERLAQRLLQRHLAEVGGLLSAGDEAQAVACVQQFCRQAWMQAVDRSAAYAQTLVNWMIEADGVTPEFFKRVSQVFGWDERNERLPIAEWQRQQLQNRPDPRWFSRKIARLLLVREPHNTEESAAWMLFQDLDVLQRRRLADGFIELDWAACEQMQRVAASQPAEMLGELQTRGNFDWQRYRHGQRWPAVYAWLVAFCVLVFAVANCVPHSLHWSGRGEQGGTLLLLIESGLSGVFAALLLSGVHGAWNWLARCLTATDLALAQRFFPPALHCDGAGLLPLRNGVPVLALGALVATLFGTATELSALQIVPLTVLGTLLPAAYVLLQFFRPDRRAPRLSRWWRVSIEALAAGLMWAICLAGLGAVLWFSFPHP